MKALHESYASLTAREREVMVLVVSGLLNKQVGGELGISEITVKAHRGQVMRKMKADSLPALVEHGRLAGPRPTLPGSVAGIMTCTEDELCRYQKSMDDCALRGAFFGIVASSGRESSVVGAIAVTKFCAEAVHMAARAGASRS